MATARSSESRLVLWKLEPEKEPGTLCLRRFRLRVLNCLIRLCHLTARLDLSLFWVMTIISNDLWKRGFLAVLKLSDCIWVFLWIALEASFQMQ